MTVIHFIYSGNPLGRDLNAPATIAQNLYRHFKGLGYGVKYYDWAATASLKPAGPNDVILGHPNYPEDSATKQLFKISETPHKFLLFPIHFGLPHINWPFDQIVGRAAHVFGIMGPYWYDTMPNSKFAHWRSKVTRVDMAVDSKAFPFVRRSFAPRGRRAFAYLGSDRPEKGLELLAGAFRRTRCKLHVFGNVGCGHVLRSLPNVEYHGWAVTDPDFGRRLTSLADAFLNPSISDANPTTLLEAAAWGLAVACSPQSGYYGGGSPFWSANFEDPDAAAGLLDFINGVDEKVLWDRVRSQRAAVETHYTWDRFCRIISDKIGDTVGAS